MSDSNSAPTAGQTADPNAGSTPEERYNRVAEAAYLRAAARGFVGGDPMKDWLEAEADLMRPADHSRAEQVDSSQAGKNDCATSMNDCHGHVEKDSNVMAWIYVPKGTCTKIAGAHLVQVQEPAPKKS